MLEQWIQTKIQKFLIKEEWYDTVNLISTNRAWIPDLLILLWKGKHFWIEVKKSDWELSKIQQYRIKILRKKWDIVLVPYNYKEFKEQYLLIKSELWSNIS